MVSVMVEKFREMQVMLGDMIEHYETPEFKALDGRIATVFDAIYRHAPRNAEEARTMVGLFLDIIENNDAGDNVHLIARVRSIIESCPGQRPSPMDVGSGSGI